MKSVWAEVLTSAQFARRWRICNGALSSLYTEDSKEEYAWRTETLQLLSRAHTLGAAEEASFKIVQTIYADMAFELAYETFKWKWETCFVGHKTSADIISKHLLFPLISLNHLAFSSPQGIVDLSDADAEKAVDKVGRTARRSVDTHVKNAISKPRTASALRRMTALLNFNSDLPRVVSTAEKPDLEIAQLELKYPEPLIYSRPITVASLVEDMTQTLKPSHVEAGSSLKPPVPDDDNSATEESDGDDDAINEKLPILSQLPPILTQPVSRITSAPRSPIPTAPSKDESDSDSSPAIPVKNPKRSAPELSSDDDSEGERKRRVAQLKGGSGSGGGKRGTRQPIKRGGKRF
ncbi:hypothetical protein H2248_008670 [Termitomyces sp. 'cryptogamus']|nr:hypothetical protein H2248_008670 [Termitomyces sp. 'cryptogamus']